MTNLQKQNLQHTESEASLARVRFEKADRKLKEATSALEYAAKQHNEALQEKSAALAAFRDCRERFLEVVNTIVSEIPGTEDVTIIFSESLLGRPAIRFGH